jgi:hypothetical protein
VEQPAGKAKEEREKYSGETEMRVARAKEKKGSGKKEINRTLCMSHEAETMEDALKAIECYSVSIQKVSTQISIYSSLYQPVQRSGAPQFPFHIRPCFFNRIVIRRIRRQVQ